MLLLLLSNAVQASCWPPESPTLLGWVPQAGKVVPTQTPAILLRWDQADPEQVDPGELRLESPTGVLVPTSPTVWEQGSSLFIQLAVEDTLTQGAAYRVLWQDAEVTHFVVGPGVPRARRVEIQGLVAEHWNGGPDQLFVSGHVNRDPHAAWYRVELRSQRGVETFTHTSGRFWMGDMGCGFKNTELVPGERLSVRVQALDAAGEPTAWSEPFEIDVPSQHGATSQGVDWRKDRTWNQLVQSLTVFCVCLLVGALGALRGPGLRPRRLPAWSKGPTPLDGS